MSDYRYRSSARLSGVLVALALLGLLGLALVYGLGVTLREYQQQHEKETAP